MRNRVGIWLFVMVVIVSLNVPLTRLALQDLDPFAFALIRFSAGAAVLVAYAYRREGRFRVDARDWPAIVFGAIVGVLINQLSFMTAVATTSAANVSLIIGMVPLITATFASWMKLERIRFVFWLSLLLGACGIILVVQSTGTAPGSSEMGGNLAAALTAITWGGYSVFARLMMRRYAPLHIAALVMSIGAVSLLPFGLPPLVSQDLSALSATTWLALAFSTLLGLVAAQVIYFAAIKRVGPSRAASFTYLQPVLGVIFSILLLAESLAPVQIVGGSMIVAGIVAGRRYAPAVAPT